MRPILPLFYPYFNPILFPKESIDEAYFTPILPPIFPKESIDEVIIL